jgi:phospholipid/cholesterol/gamma-HCH transport system substrate-binding protein
VGLFLIGERRMLFASTVDGVAEFTRVSGLQTGRAGPRERDAGRPRHRRSPCRQAPSSVPRAFAVRDDLHQLVRTDSVASIQTEGLVGGTYLAISAGSAAAEQLPDGGTIRGATLRDGRPARADGRHAHDGERHHRVAAR